METVEQTLPRNGGRTVELVMAEATAAGRGDRDWHSLRTNPDYRAEWREHGAAASFVESLGFPLPTQSEADLEAARWGLLTVGRSADEKPGLAVLGRRQDGPVPGGEAGRDALAVLARETGVSFTGLRLRDGSLVLKPKRGRRVEQLWIIDGDSFDFDRTIQVVIRSMPTSKAHACSNRYRNVKPFVHGSDAYGAACR